MQLTVLPRAGPHNGLPAAARALTSMVANMVRTRVQGEHTLLNPLFVSWEINSACNLRCPYCYLKDRSYGFTDKGLSFDQIKLVLHRIKAVSPDVLLLGGEPFLHPAWDDIVDHCEDVLGLRVRCITNGTRLEAHPHLTILINFVLCSDDDPVWVSEQIDSLATQGYNIFVNVDRYFGEGRVDPRIVACLKRVKRRDGRIHMTDQTLDWLENTLEPVPFCSPTLLPLLDPRARLIYPCCYYDEQTAGTLLDTDYTDLLRASARRFGHYPFDKCATCSTTAYLDASVAVRKPLAGVKHYHTLYNR